MCRGERSWSAAAMAKRPPRAHQRETRIRLSECARVNVHSVRPKWPRVRRLSRCYLDSPNDEARPTRDALRSKPAVDNLKANASCACRRVRSCVRQSVRARVTEQPHFDAKAAGGQRRASGQVYPREEATPPRHSSSHSLTAPPPTTSPAPQQGTRPIQKPI
eukprot:4566063-Pleurochrysis_carterae.AAC.1